MIAIFVTLSSFHNFGSLPVFATRRYNLTPENFVPSQTLRITHRLTLYPGTILQKVGSKSQRGIYPRKCTPARARALPKIPKFLSNLISCLRCRRWAFPSLYSCDTCTRINIVPQWRKERGWSRKKKQKSREHNRIVRPVESCKKSKEKERERERKTGINFKRRGWKILRH